MQAKYLANLFEKPLGEYSPTFLYHTKKKSAHHHYKTNGSPQRGTGRPPYNGYPHKKPMPKLQLTRIHPIGIGRINAHAPRKAGQFLSFISASGIRQPTVTCHCSFFAFPHKSDYFPVAFPPPAGNIPITTDHFAAHFNSPLEKSQLIRKREPPRRK